MIIDRIRVDDSDYLIKENKNDSSMYINKVDFYGSTYYFRENNSDYKYMTIAINLDKVDTEDYLTYLDDAVDMLSDDSAWDTFFGHFPCTLNESTKEVKKLDVNNFSKYEDNTNRDNTLDTMICFPLRGIRIFKNGNQICITITDNPDDSDFQYYAHTYNGIKYNKVYISVYKLSRSDGNQNTFNNSCKAQSRASVSLSQTAYFRDNRTVSPSITEVLNNLKIACTNKGERYDLYGYYQQLLIQCMFILKYKSLNSQGTIGRGWVNKSNDDGTTTTGATDEYGMDSKIKREAIGKDFTYCTQDESEMMNNTRHPNYHVKIFGLEDPWGAYWTLLDNAYSKSDKKIYLSDTSGTPPMNSYYKARLTLNNSTTRGWTRNVFGTNDLGFLGIDLVKENLYDKYFCDETNIDLENKDFVFCTTGGGYDELASAGLFLTGFTSSYVSDSLTSRFCYFEI